MYSNNTRLSTAEEEKMSLWDKIKEDPAFYACLLLFAFMWGSVILAAVVVELYG